MKSGLRDRNNAKQFVAGWGDPTVSMKSGLRDRNNPVVPIGNSIPIQPSQ